MVYTPSDRSQTLRKSVEDMQRAEVKKETRRLVQLGGSEKASWKRLHLISA